MGITQFTTKAHIVRATLEGIGFQTREVKFGHLIFLFL
jgi:glycerol kinase